MFFFKIAAEGSDSIKLNYRAFTFSKIKPGFVDSRFVKTCDELVIDLKHRLGLCSPSQPLLWIPENCKPLANYHQRNLSKIMLNWKKD